MPAPGRYPLLGGGRMSNTLTPDRDQADQFLTLLDEFRVVAS